MHLEIVCDSTEILVHWMIMEIAHECQDALFKVLSKICKQITGLKFIGAIFARSMGWDVFCK